MGIGFIRKRTYNKHIRNRRMLLSGHAGGEDAAVNAPVAEGIENLVDNVVEIEDANVVEEVEDSVSQYDVVRHGKKNKKRRVAVEKIQYDTETTDNQEKILEHGSDFE